MQTHLHTPQNGKERRLYQSVVDYILGQIRQGRLRPGEPIGSVKDIAGRLEVSVSTVQQALQTLASKGIVVRKARSGTMVSSDALTHIKADVDVSKLIALFIPDIVNAEFALLMRGLQDAAGSFGLDVVCVSTDDRPEEYEEGIKRQIDARAYGMVLVPPIHGHLSMDTIAAIERSDVPVVLCYRAAGLVRWPVIVEDYAYGTWLTVSHLAEIGCRKIACVDLNMPESDFEFAYGSDYHVKHQFGYLKALSEFGLTEHYLFKSLKVREDYETMDMEDVRGFLATHPEIDGISAVNDRVAAVLIRTLAEMGRKVPEEVAVTGGGNFSQFLGFEAGYITSRAGQFGKMAGAACDLLRQYREGQKTAPGLKIEVKTELINGRSTAR